MRRRGERFQTGEGKVTVYLASPNTQQQAEHACDMPVLLSFAICPGWMDRYQQTFSRILIDSGAYSELNSGVKIDVSEYAEWMKRWDDHADAIAGLDDISGDWRRSLANYEYGGFPTFHDTDPPELLSDLIELSRERRNWIGVSVKPPREGKDKERWVRTTVEKIPPDLHLHFWAGRRFTKFRRIDSVDSTNWWRDAMKLRTINGLQHLTYGECLDIVVKRYKRETRTIEELVECQGMFKQFD